MRHNIHWKAWIKICAVNKLNFGIQLLNNIVRRCVGVCVGLWVNLMEGMGGVIHILLQVLRAYKQHKSIKKIISVLRYWTFELPIFVFEGTQYKSKLIEKTDVSGNGQWPLKTNTNTIVVSFSIHSNDIHSSENSGGIHCFENSQKHIYATHFPTTQFWHNITSFCDRESVVLTQNTFRLSQWNIFIR